MAGIAALSLQAKSGMNFVLLAGLLLLAMSVIYCYCQFYGHCYAFCNAKSKAVFLKFVKMLLLH
jgi:hypothetical protein